MKPKPNFEKPIHELLQKRWSPRAFSDKLIEEEHIMSLFEAARWAASAMNEQPWRFIYASKTNKTKFDNLLSCLLDNNKIWAKNASVLIMTLVKVNFQKNNIKNEWALHDLGLAIGNLTIQASALDIYIHNIGGFSIEKAFELFHIPEGFEPKTMITLGYLGNAEQLSTQLREREEATQERIPLKDLFID